MTVGCQLLEESVRLPSEHLDRDPLEALVNGKLVGLLDIKCVLALQEWKMVTQVKPSIIVYYMVTKENSWKVVAIHVARDGK
jgi:hypothetical protein